MRIFVSHGMDKTDPGDMQFLAELHALLQAADADGPAHDVLLDEKRIEPGWKWTDVLHEWLAECQAAILVLSPRALDRDWVLKEATILAYRKARDPAFPLLTVLRGVAAEAVDGKGFSPLCLSSWQMMKGETTPEAITRVVKTQLSELGTPRRSPLEELEDALKSWIEDADRASLERIAEQLTGQAIPWTPQESRGARLAREIARAIVRGQQGGTLATLIQKLRLAKVGVDAAQTVLWLACPQWVSPDAAAILAEVAGRNRLPHPGPPPAGISVALSCGNLPFSTDRYVRRVLLPTTKGQIVYAVAGGGSDAWEDELIGSIRREYLRQNRRPLSEKAEKTDARLAAIDGPAAAEPIYFVIPAPLPDPLLLDTLQKTFPRVTFILHTGDEPAQVLPPRVVPLAPPLDADREDQMYDDFVQADNAIGKH